MITFKCILFVNLSNKLSVPKRFLHKTLHKMMQNNLVLNSVHSPLKSTITTNNYFRFTDYDCIGFDLDNTICRYKVGPMVKMEYEILSKYLIEKKQYPEKYLLKPIEENLDFLMKGLIMDFRNGNLLTINSGGKILQASHGTKFLSQLEVEKEYGVSRHWDVTDTFSKNVLATWNGPLSEEMRSLLDYFDMPTGLAFARLVDTLDEIAGKRLEKYNLWPDLLEGLIDMFEVQKFEMNAGGYFPAMKSTPEAYIEKCDKSVIPWLQTLKSQGKFLFLITGSYIDFASLVADTCMGKQWRSLFDIVIFYAKKPGFFTERREFIPVDGATGKELKLLKTDPLQCGEWYVQGNWTDLYHFLEKATNKPKPRVAYVGDNLIQDIYTPAVHTTCDTVAVVEELQAEGMFGYECSHPHDDYLTSQSWGSFFGKCYHQDGVAMVSNGSIWTEIIQKHAKLCVPTMAYLTTKPVDYKYFV